MHIVHFENILLPLTHQIDNLASLGSVAALMVHPLSKHAHGVHDRARAPRGSTGEARKSAAGWTTLARAPAGWQERGVTVTMLKSFFCPKNCSIVLCAVEHGHQRR